MMSQKTKAVMLAIVALGLAAAPRADAGDVMVERENTSTWRADYILPIERVYYPRPVTDFVRYPTLYFGWPHRPHVQHWPYGNHREHAKHGRVRH